MNNSKYSLTFLLLALIFCTALLASNLFSIKILSIGPLTASAAVVVFPIVYIVNDCIVEIYGYKKAKLVIGLGFANNLVFIVWSQIAVALPSADFWTQAPAFDFVFGLAPRIVCASLLAFVVGSLLNARTMSVMKMKSHGENFSLRAIVSTIVGELADSVIFYPLAFGGLLAVKELLALIALQVVVKTLYEVVCLPLTVRIVDRIKHLEQQVDNGALP